MSYLDKVTVGGTTYDVQDSASVHFTAQTLTEANKAQARTNIAAACDDVAGRLSAAMSMPDYKWQDTVQTATHNTLTATRYGTRLALNGQASVSGSLRVRMGGPMLYASSPSAEQNASAYAANFTSGHEYAVIMKLISGTVTPNSASNPPAVAIFAADGTSAFSLNFAVKQSDVMVRTFTSDGTAGVLWWSCANQDQFATAVYEISVIDLTVGRLTDRNEALDVTTLTSATPTITAEAGVRYNCTATAVTELSFTPSSSGICSVRFKSGSTATVLTLPNTVKMPSWWTGTEANRWYEISIEDGVYGVVTTWA